MTNKEQKSLNLQGTKKVIKRMNGVTRYEQNGRIWDEVDDLPNVRPIEETGSMLYETVNKLYRQGIIEKDCMFGGLIED